MTNKRGIVSILAGLFFLFGSAMVASAADDQLVALDTFKLTEEQMSEIEDIVGEYIAKEHAIMSDIETKFAELTNELRQEDRFETRRKEKKSVKHVNSMVKEISGMYGQLIKTKVEYILKVKNILTAEQRLQLIHSLTFDDEFFDEALPEYVELDVLIDILGLTNDQLKKIIGTRTDMLIKELKIEKDIEFKVLDLEEALLEEEVDTETVDKIILDITDLGTQLIDNKVKYKLKAKDVLTAEQKKKMLHVILLMSKSNY